MLRVAEVTYVMENQMLEAAALSEQERLETGRAISRTDLSLSISILVKNSELEKISSAVPASASSLAWLATILSSANSTAPRHCVASWPRCLRAAV